MRGEALGCARSRAPRGSILRLRLLQSTSQTQPLTYHKNVISLCRFSRCSKIDLCYLVALKQHNGFIVSFHPYNLLFPLLRHAHCLHETNPDPNPPALLLSILNYYRNIWILERVPVVLRLIRTFSRKLRVTSWCSLICHDSHFSHQPGHQKSLSITPIKSESPQHVCGLTVVQS